MKQKRVMLLLSAAAIASGLLFVLPGGIQVLPQPFTPANRPMGHVPDQPDHNHGQASSGNSNSSRNPTAASSTPSPAATASSSAESAPAGRMLAPDKPQYAVLDNKQYPVRTYEPLLMPNDPNANQIWVNDAKLPQAWDIAAGSTETVLAIIDSGFALQHEEFSGRWYANQGETGPTTNQGPSLLNCSDRGLALSASCNLIDDNQDGILDNESGAATRQNPSRLNCSDQGIALDKACNRLDDDANGFVDDVNGWDFANNDPSAQAGQTNPSGSGTTHGSRVAGIAAATGNNSVGIAGVNWQTKILPLQALDDDGYGNTLGVGQAILYAAARGADVISLSLGSDLPDDYVRQAVRVAIASGSVVVAASGNDGCACMVYPANYPEVLAVGASNNGQPAGFSSYGANLDILAPGVGMLSTSWTAANPTNAYASNIAGTSYATPLVSGLLARLLSQQPTAKPLQLIAALTENSGRSGLTALASANRSDTTGYGIADAATASGRMAVADTPAIAYRFTPASTGSSFNAQSPAEPDGTFQAQACSDPLRGGTPLQELQRGSHTIYSLSQAEAWQAQLAGYTTRRFAEVCLTQPHDTPAVVRNLNIFKEFRNIYENKL